MLGEKLMAGEIITTQELEDAKVDAKDLGEAVNEDKVITPRYGDPYMSAAMVSRTLIEMSVPNAKYYLTKSALDADLANVADGQYAMVVNDLDAQEVPTENNGLYCKIGGVWEFLAWNPIFEVKKWANANPLFKPVQVKAGDNPNDYLKPGIYYHWGVQIAAADLPNWPYYISGNACFGTLVVENPHPSAAESSGVTQTFYPYLDNFSPYLRKKSQAGSVWLPWTQYITDYNKNNITTLTTEGVDVLALPLGTYHWASIAFGNSLLNMPDCPYKFGRLEIRAGAGGHTGTYKVVIFYPYGRDKNFYINTNFENNTWTGWRTHKDSETLEVAIAATYATKTQLNSSVSTSAVGVVEGLMGADYFGKSYTDPQMLGNMQYVQAYYAGYNQVTTKAVIFNSIEAFIYNPSGESVEWRLYTGSKCALGQYGNIVLAANALLPDASGFIDDLPTAANEPVLINLGKVIHIPENTPFVIVFRTVELQRLRIGAFHQTNPEAMPDRGFSLWAQAQEWGEFNISTASPASGYRQTGFRLKLENNKSGTTTEFVQKHKPVVVMPPKLYVMQGLQAHIYPEHLLFERPSLYDHDIICTKGKQMERGWVWDHNPSAPDPFGVVGLTWNIHDVETTELLSEGTTNINFVDPNNKNGQNLKVCVIGDSLVNASAMTARLLAIAETDVTNIELIGTRGSGLNLHEGRGGWTINDYTGAGRTYYKFDVSGVTTIPAINSAIYSMGATTLLVQEVNISGGAGSIICSLNSGAAPTVGTSGVLNKSNGSAGDSSITYSNVQTVSGNPFWNATTSSVDFSEYLSRYSLQLPDIVFIQLGVNDTFGFTSDQAVIDFCGTAFPKLDTLINSIKSANPSAKIVVMTPPVYANQDAFGTNYACNQNAWRAKRNIVGFNKLLISNYSDKESNSIYLLGSGVNVDTVNNFSTGVININSHNQNNITIQVNGVHPATSGYYQIGDAMWACLKAI